MSEDKMKLGLSVRAFGSKMFTKVVVVIDGVQTEAVLHRSTVSKCGFDLKSVQTNVQMLVDIKMRPKGPAVSRVYEIDGVKPNKQLQKKYREKLREKRDRQRKK